jgi:hypothetical protein
MKKRLLTLKDFIILLGCVLNISNIEAVKAACVHDEILPVSEQTA